MSWRDDLFGRRFSLSTQSVTILPFFYPLGCSEISFTTQRLISVHHFTGSFVFYRDVRPGPHPTTYPAGKSFAQSIFTLSSF